MAKKVSLLVYGLSIIDGKNERICLNQVLCGKSLIDIVKEYISANISKYTSDTSKEMLFQFDTVDTKNIVNKNGQRTFRILYGRVKTGEYGIESELVDIHTGDITNRTPNQADMIPFGFCIAVPCGEVNSAVIILQTLGIYGMKMSLQHHLEKCITDVSSDLHLLLRSIVPKEYIDRYFRKGILKKIKMTRYEIPEDESNRLGINYGVKQTKEERIIHKPLGFMEKNKKIFSEVFAGQKSYTDIIQIDGFEYDDLKLEFALEGTNKTFNMKDMNSLVVNENITKKVVIKGGHPTFESLKPIMKKTAKEYLIGMGLLVD
jgi:hypothetical protein